VTARLALLAPLLLALVAAQAPAPAAPEAVAAATSGAPVVLELFTSQGCSSCPPADRLLSRLGRSREGDVLPLGFHVDYWNYIGWTDPFSSPEWSRRQQDYARRFGSNRIYTPQLVVQGTAECVGSQADCVEAAVARARATPPSWELAVRVSPAGPERLRAVVEGRRVVAGEAGDAELLVALTESGLVTPVGRGENARRTLRDDHVVRRLVRAPAPAPEATVDLDLEPGWDRRRLAVVAFVQDRRSLRILGAATAAVAGPSPSARP
jgi:hypothetical protein